MCGDLDEGLELDNEVLERFLQMSKHLGVTPQNEPRSLPDLEDTSGRSAYMNDLFSAGLTRAVSDAAAANEGQRVEAIASQAIAFARLAGFLAGQLPPEADLFRASIEALTDGHAMPGRTREKIKHDHDHHHGHHHGHEH
jgi:hypothetical protein